MRTTTSQRRWPFAMDQAPWLARPCPPSAPFALALALALLPAFSAAQSSLGTIRGTVRDDQGNPIALAAIRAVDESTGVVRLAETDVRGDYEFVNLRAGTYRVEDNSPGFVAFRKTGVVLRAAETVRADLTLSALAPEAATAGDPQTLSAPPTAMEAITVSAHGGANVQVESPALQGGLDAQQLSTLPRASRDFSDFVSLNPNVVGAGGTGGTLFHYLGGMTYGLSYLQDGQPSNGTLFGNLTFSAPGLDAIDEVKVLSNAYGAEFGGIAAVVVTTRRGGRAYSGTAFYDFGGNELNALTYNQKQDGLERGNPVLDTHDHRYGVFLGGPIKKEQTFFFVDYEGSRASRVGGGGLATVPTEALRRGDFRGTTAVVRDPVTGLPFPGNVIPAGRIDPVASRVLDFYYPLPNLAPRETGFGQYREFADLQETRHRGDVRLDHEPSPNDSLLARFSWLNRNPQPSLENALFPHLGPVEQRVRSRTVTGSWNRVFSSHAVNEVRMGFHRQNNETASRYRVGEVADLLGMELPESARERLGFPHFVFGGAISNIADNSPNANRVTRQSSLSLSDTLALTRGRHSLRLGASYSRDKAADGQSIGVRWGGGRVVFDGRRSGNAFSDFLLGLPASSMEGVTTRGLHPLEVTSHVYAGFVQDDFRVNNRLTVFAGLRYEVATAFRETGDLLVNFDPGSGQLVLPSRGVEPLLSSRFASLPRVTADALGVGRALVKTDTNNLSPRLGFAYRLGSANQTVIRGGVGRFFPAEAAQGVRDALSRGPFNYERTRQRPPLSAPLSPTPLPESVVMPAVGAVDLGLQTPEVIQYNLTVERELPGGFGLRVSYTGARLRKLITYRLFNTLPASTVPFDPNRPSDRLRLPFPNLGTDSFIIENGARGHYDAFQIEARRRYRNGLAFNLAYTLAKTQSQAPDVGNSTTGVIQYDPYDIDRNEGPDPFITRHRFLAYGSWDVPVGRGRRYLARAGRGAEALFGGWTVTAIVFARSGFYLTPYYSGVDRNGVNPANTRAPLNNDFEEMWRPDVVGDPRGPRSRDNFFNLAAFRPAAPGTLGNAAPGSLEGPGTLAVNFGLYKQVFRAGRVAGQLRATLENAFNHPQFFVNPINSPDDAFLNLTDRFEGTDNPTTNRLREVARSDGFAAGRVIRLGVRLEF